MSARRNATFAGADYTKTKRARFHRSDGKNNPSHIVQRAPPPRAHKFARLLCRPQSTFPSQLRPCRVDIDVRALREWHSARNFIIVDTLPQHHPQTTRSTFETPKISTTQCLGDGAKRHSRKCAVARSPWSDAVSQPKTPMRGVLRITVGSHGSPSTFAAPPSPHSIYTTLADDAPNPQYTPNVCCRFVCARLLLPHIQTGSRYSSGAPLLGAIAFQPGSNTLWVVCVSV